MHLPLTLPSLLPPFLLYRLWQCGRANVLLVACSWTALVRARVPLSLASSLVHKHATRFRRSLRDYAILFTVGHGGHALELLQSNPTARLICLDVDSEVRRPAVLACLSLPSASWCTLQALTVAERRLRPFKPRVTLEQREFSVLPEVLADAGVCLRSAHSVAQCSADPLLLFPSFHMHVQCVMQALSVLMASWLIWACYERMLKPRLVASAIGLMVNWTCVTMLMIDAKLLLMTL
jgi:hypothetical protein